MSEINKKKSTTLNMTYKLEAKSSTAVLICDGFEKAMFPIERNYFPVVFTENFLFANSKQKSSIFQRQLEILQNSNLFNKIIVLARDCDKIYIQKYIEKKHEDLIFVFYKNITDEVTINTLLFCIEECVEKTQEQIFLLPSRKLFDNHQELSKSFKDIEQKISINDCKIGLIKGKYGLLDFCKHLFCRSILRKKNAILLLKSIIYGSKTEITKQILHSVNLKSINFGSVITSANVSIVEQPQDCILLSNARLKNIKYVATTAKISDFTTISGFFKFLKPFNLYKNFSSNISCDKNVEFVKTSKSYVSSKSIDNKNVKILGLKGITVIDSNDLLVISKNSYLKKTDKLVSQNKNYTNYASKVFRPWGYYEILRDDNHYKVKTIIVNPQSSLSLQSHTKRAEHWVVTKGIATVVLNEDTFLLNPGQYIHIPIGARHSLQNHTDDYIEVIETQVGDYFGEDDIIRYKDIYGRL